MGNVIGQDIELWVVNQIKARQKVQGSGTNQTRTPEQIAYLNSNTTWIKLASGVSISDSSRLINSDLNPSLTGMELAKNNVLFGGTSTFNGSSLTQKQGFDKTYQYSEFGPVPMAGIISADIKYINRGSIRKANVKIKAHNKKQFETLSLLYLRLGYNVMLEWGNTFFTTNGTDLQKVENTIIENLFFSSPSKSSYKSILPRIKDYQEIYHGNYDGMFGKVTNFSWTFNQDASYDIDLTITSAGDVIESIKTNLSIDNKTSKFLTEFRRNAKTANNTPVIIETYKDDNIISSMLFLWKYFDHTDTEAGTTRPEITIEQTKSHKVGEFLNNGGNTATFSSSVKTWNLIHWVGGGPGGAEIESDKTSISSPAGTVDFDKFIRDEALKKYNQIYPSHPEVIGNAGKYENNSFGPKNARVQWVESVTTTTTSNTDNPLKNAPSQVAFKIQCQNPEQFYLKFGYLLQFLKENVIPEISTNGSNSPIVDIVYSKNSSLMYCLPSSISLDPRVCLVKNKQFIKSDKKPDVVLGELESWNDIDSSGTNINLAYAMNIYLNFGFINSCISSNVDEKGNVNIYNFLSAICTGLNQALGGINNLEPIIDESENILKIIDSTPIPGVLSTPSYFMQLFGYYGTQSNFIRNLDIKTAITPEYATMISIGATAGGYVKGTEATAFARWNEGITDRFRKTLIPSNPSSATIGDENEAEYNYVHDFIGWKTYCYGFSGVLGDTPSELGTISDDIINKNISIATEYYKYVMASSKEKQGGGIGFIPFKLSFTMDGLSGIKIYNRIVTNTKFLPKDYGDALNFIVTEISHKLGKHDWETEIQTISHPNSTPLKIPDFKITNVLNNTPRPQPVTTTTTSTPSTAVSPSAVPFTGTVPPNLLIGDSQTPDVDAKSTKFSRLKPTGGPGSLWQSGWTALNMRDDIKAFAVSPQVKNVALCVGTNGGFGKFMNDDVPGLMAAVKLKFPNAKIFVIQGSWGWTAVPGTVGLKNILESEVNAYYTKYTNLGATLINPKIGFYPTHPGAATPSFALIGQNLDNAIP
jgi:hypothetical protein